MLKYTWLPYTGSGATTLAVVLFIVALLVAFLGTLIRRPVAVTRPGRTVAGFMIVVWLLSIYTFLIALVTYGVQLHQRHLPTRPPADHIFPLTLLFALGTLIIVCAFTWKYGWKTAIGGGLVAAMAAPMMFELPFDIVVMMRIYPAVPPFPLLYRELFFFPLFLIIITTISLLTIVSSMRISRYALYALGGMFFVFALWALSTGFAYPNDPLSRTFNIISKALAFVAAITLFVRRDDQGS